MEPPVDWLAHGTSYLLLVILLFGAKYHLKVVKEANDERIRCEVAKAKLEADFRESIAQLKDEHVGAVEEFNEKQHTLVERVIVAIDLLKQRGK